MKKILVVLLILIIIPIIYFYPKPKTDGNLNTNECVALIIPVFDEKQLTIDEFTTKTIDLCKGDEYLIDYSNVFALKNDVKRFKINLSKDATNKIQVTQEEEWLKGEPTGNFIDSKEKVFTDGNKECFHAISPILMDVMVDYCFYEVTPNTLELKIEYESTFPI